MLPLKTSTMNPVICSYSSGCHLKCLERKPLKLSLYTVSLGYFHAEKSSSLKRSVYFFKTNNNSFTAVLEKLTENTGISFFLIYL